MVRKNFISLSADERKKFAHALNKLWDEGVIQKNAKFHEANFDEGIHWGPAFLPWHRDFLRKLEKDLQRHEPTVNLPFWDWTRSDSRALNAEPWESFFGGRDNKGGQFDHWTYTRREKPDPGMQLATLSAVLPALGRTTFAGFRGIEGVIHGTGHNWVGGTMAGGASPLDPLFYLHHCNVDRLWYIWQLNHKTAVQYDLKVNRSVDTEPKARVAIDKPMVGGATPRAQLDLAKIGYGYDGDPTLEAAWKKAKGTNLVTH